MREWRCRLCNEAPRGGSVWPDERCGFGSKGNAMRASGRVIVIKQGFEL